jgi:rubredoxin
MKPHRKWMCLTCGHIYDESLGDPATGHPPGTPFEDLPLSWRCPDCGAGKEDFELTVD